MTFALVWVGVPLAPALLAVVTYRLFNFWLPVIPALAALPAMRRMRHDFRPSAYDNGLCESFFKTLKDDRAA
jgi:uncharacterized membrane protein YbhN (UPF0104 family)